MSEKLRTRVARTIARYRLFEPGARVDVALSGGADSTALLALLVEMSGELGITLRSHHVRHGLRDDDERDARIAAETAARLGVDHLETRLTPADGSGDRGPEANARRARYASLTAAAQAHGATRLATGHHADDVVETHLLRLLRGAGLEGLAGIRPRRTLAPGLELVRPLLEVRRDALVGHVEALGLPSALDPTNLQRDALRNRLRHDVVPALAAVRRGGLDAAARSIGLLRQDAAAIEALAEAVVDRGWLTAEPAWYLPHAELARLGPAAVAQVLRHAARRVVAGHTPSTQTIERGLAALALWPEQFGTPAPGRRGLWRDAAVALGRDGRFAVVRGVSSRDPEPPPDCALAVPWPPPGVASNDAFEVQTWVSSGPRGDDELEIPSHVPLPDGLAVVAAGVVWGAQATVDPMGLRGHKTLRRAIAELGVPAPWRSHHPVLVDSAGRCLWIVGGPMSRRLAPSMSDVDASLRIRVRVRGRRRGWT